MRTDRRPDRRPGAHPDEPIDPPEPAPAGPSPGARAGTVAFFVVVGLIGWFLATRGAGRAPEEGGAGIDRATPGAASVDALPAGRYRLPGLTVPVSITVPEGWIGGGSAWGPTNRGLAAISTGTPGARVSIALLDLDALRPVDPLTGDALARSVDDRWFRRWLDTYATTVAPRVRDRVVGQRVDWEPPPALAWLLTFTDRGPIGFADDIVYDGLPGDLATFSFPGPRREVFLSDDGAVELRPGVTYTFWIPRGPDGPRVMLGVARELGAVPGTAEWEVVRTLELGD